MGYNHEKDYQLIKDNLLSTKEVIENFKPRVKKEENILTAIF